MYNLYLPSAAYLMEVHRAQDAHELLLQAQLGANASSPPARERMVG
jgi:hypothetical protein